MNEKMFFKFGKLWSIRWWEWLRDRLDKDIQYFLYRNVFKSIDGMTKQGVGKDFLEAFFSLDSLELQKIDLT